MTNTSVVVLACSDVSQAVHYSASDDPRVFLSLHIYFLHFTYYYELTNYLHCPNTARDCGIGRNGETPLQTDPLTLTASPFVSVSVECTRVVDVDG